MQLLLNQVVTRSSYLIRFVVCGAASCQIVTGAMASQKHYHGTRQGLYASVWANTPFFFNEFVFKLSKLTTTKGDEHHLRWGTTRTTAQTPGKKRPDTPTPQSRRPSAPALSIRETFTKDTPARLPIQAKILCHTRNSSRSSPSFAPSQKPAYHRHTRNAAPSQKFANRNHTRIERTYSSRSSPSFAPSQKPAYHRHARNAAPSQKFARNHTRNLQR